MRPIDMFSYLKNNRVLQDMTSLNQLYFPIIGAQATAVYSYFLTCFDNGVRQHKFSEALNHLQVGMGELEESLDRLTAIDLLVLYQTTESYVIQLKSPLNHALFLAEPVYRRLLETRIGQVAVEELDVKLPMNARDISKTFSQVFSSDGTPIKRQSVSKNHFDMDNFQNLMTRDGLQIANLQEDTLAIFKLAESYKLSWFDTYQLAKDTAVNRVISPQRMQIKLEQPKTKSDIDESGLTVKEKTIIQEAKQSSADIFLDKLKVTRRAVMTKSEEQLLVELANMGFLDEVINVMILYTLSKTKSANVNKAYIMKIANDFSYEKVVSAEQAVLKMRSFQSGKAKSKNQKSSKSNVPEWTKKDYKQEATAEERAELEALKRSLLEE